MHKNIKIQKRNFVQSQQVLRLSKKGYRFCWLGMQGIIRPENQEMNNYLIGKISKGENKLKNKKEK